MLGGIKAYIPGTQARRERLFGASLANMASGHDGVLEIEWDDRTKSLKPVTFDPEQHKLVAEDGFEAKLKGLGSEPKRIAGVPMWNVSAANYGVISTQAALIADRERRGEGRYEGHSALRFLLEQYIRELKDFATIDASDAKSEQAVATDGGAAAMSAGEAAQSLAQQRSDPIYDTLADWLAQAPSDLTVYDLNPPEDYDGEVFSVKDPDDFDPYPVTREDTARAVDWAKQSATGDDQWWSGFVTALVVAGAMYGLFRIVPAVIAWILGALGGGGGGVNIGMSIAPALVGVLF